MTSAAVTNVPVPLWEAFEDNDLYGWPSGVLARAFVSEYARLIREDPIETVNEFCRLFPQGDRWDENLLAGWAKSLEFHRFTALGTDSLAEFRRI